MLNSLFIIHIQILLPSKINFFQSTGKERFKSVVSQTIYIVKGRYEKICYDNTGNVLNKGRNFNTHTIGKMYLIIVFRMISRHWFQTKLLLYIAYFWRFWGKNVIFSLYNQPKTK